MQQSEKHTGWQSFVSLGWYAGLISFIFRFVAMTSEPLLALGVILSAADFLQQGHLMAHNPMLTAAWAWAQALAIEASTGPTLAFALGAFRAGDKIKGRLYSLLAGLLFVVGGAMLFLQLVSNVTGSSEVAVTPWVLYTLLALRVLVASGIVALLCTKHMRFSGLVADVPPPAAAMSEETMQAILARLAEVDELKATLARVQVDQVQPSLQPAPQALLPAPAGPENLQPIYQGQFQSKEQQINDLLRKNPQMSDEQIAEQAGCHIRTATKWASKYRSEAS